MNKNHVILLVGLLSVLLVAMAVSRPLSNIPTAEELSWPPRPVMVSGVDETLLSDYYERQAAMSVAEAADFYQRHPDWASIPEAVIPVVGSSEASDYFQRHSELNVSIVAALDLAGDFYQRHPDWASIPAASISVTGNSEALDYFQRHPEVITPAGIAVDVNDYFLRHPEVSAPTDTIDLSDYFLRH